MVLIQITGCMQVRVLIDMVRIRVSIWVRVINWVLVRVNSWVGVRVNIWVRI